MCGGLTTGSSGVAHAKRQVEAEVQTAEQELFKSDLRKRSVIEGRIGAGKRKYELDRMLTKLVETSKR
jgi:hypothetical protein